MVNYDENRNKVGGFLMYTDNKKVLKLVEFDKNDVLGLVELSTSVGWDYDEQEIRTILSSGKIYGHKNAVGKIVSSAAIIPYDTDLASIGMVIVNEEYRGRLREECYSEVYRQCFSKYLYNVNFNR